jgi:ESS family glutamate:Na+ symporter
MASTFPGVMAFAFMIAMILIGTALRAKVGVLRTALVPASLIGGLLGFSLIATGLSLGHTSADFTAFTFHFFTLSFMSLVLTGSEQGASTRTIVPGGTWLSVLWVMSLVLQALIGLAVIAGYNAASGEGLSYFLGIIVTHGFTQGPGQALAMGSIWENELGITHAINFGLIYASVGFIAAFTIGVPVARYAIKAGMNFNSSARIDDEFLTGIRNRDSDVSAGRQITHSGNVDSMTFHLSILGVAYLLTDQYLKFMQPIAAQWNLGDINFGLVFSHNLFFFHGLIVCVILRALIDRFGFGHLIDNETQRRITGTSVDLMVVATIMSIEFALLAEFIVPISLVCLSVCVTTAAMCFFAGRHLSSLGIERAVTSFGCCCGSTGSGLLLLRILDPDLSTPIAKELAFFNIAILVLSFHILMLMAPILPSYGLPTIIAVYAGTFAVGAAVLGRLARRLERAGAG